MSDSRAAPTVFLSHTFADKPFVRTLSAELGRRGISCWVDEAEIHYGESLVQKIADAIEHITLVVAVISKHSVDSPWVRRELDWAMTREIKQQRVVIIPVLVDRCDMPFFLMNKLYADFTDPAEFPATVNRLVESIFHHSEGRQPAARQVSLGDSVTSIYRPSVLPIVIDVSLLVVAALVSVFPMGSLGVFAFPRQSEALGQAVRGFGILLAAAVAMDIVRIALMRYMMRGNANFARAAADLRWSGLPSRRYRRLIRDYWSYPIVRILVAIELGTYLITLLMLLAVLRMSGIVLT